VKRLALIISLAVLLSLMAIPSAFAVSAMGKTSDLNNIPTTATLKAGSMEWDVTAAYNSDFGNRGRHITNRLFVALYDNFEFGMAWGISRPAGPVELALKYRFLKQGHHFPVSVAVGADRITGNFDRTGKNPTYYGVVGLQDVHFGGYWDLYAGFANNPFGKDKKDNSAFGGFKYWFNKRLQLNADYLGYDKNKESLISAGLNYDWAKHIGFQGWVERDSVTEDNVFVLELAVRGDMHDLTNEVSDPE